MSASGDKSIISDLTSLIKSGGLSWSDIAGKAWATECQIFDGNYAEGMYEVEDYEVKVELLDNREEQAVVKKREVVTYKQNNIIAFQDQAWGDGKVFKELPLHSGVSSGSIPSRI